jgi:hypothetical protein
MGGMGGMGPRPPGMMRRGGHVQNTSDVGRPHEELMQARRGGRTHRDAGGMTGAGGVQPPMQPAQAMGGQQLTPQQIQAAQQIAAQRRMMGAGTPMGQQKRGGRTERARGGHVPHMEAGSGGAEGRIEKVHEYGEGRGFVPKEHKGEFLRDRKGRFAGGGV